MYVRIQDEEVKISNPDKELFPSITKWDYVQYLGILSPYLLKYCYNRLLTTIRFPDGVFGESFYQKNVPASKPDFVATSKAENTQYIMLQNVPTLIWLANLACLEFHTSFHLYTDMNVPTELVFDLDPTGSPFEQVKEVALHTRTLMMEMGLDGVVKTSGASGLQIYIPLEPIHTFEETRKVSTFMARYLSEKYPNLITIERLVKDRGTKVYFDYLQHWRGKTLIAPYSPRSKEEATVSTPLEWDELETDIVPNDFTLMNIADRIQEKGDLFSSLYNGSKYNLSPLLDLMNKYL
ncbi:non-homologous end-joining DNA ligase [Shimazuella sp. AN120528]|uniref:non-homologous end-joining DNA ligase n=1 Tax=Shimazuella soli TaxID=1892854 RepID=UPI001F0F4F0A|nr:non-homologous end-joining DNA ligase [Shimazuella soli]MCH5585506.1 non-homologous end-joining DNA ligase [Shimazuella soli]